MRIQLVNAPNQTVPFVYGTLSFVLTLRLHGGVLYATVRVGGEDIVASRRVVVDDDLMPCAYMKKKYGRLVFRSKFDTPVTDYTAFNGAVYLEYEAPEEGS